MSCFGGRDEQIYLIEVFVDKLKLTEDKIKDVGEHRITIKIKFLEFPVFEITREDFDSIKPCPPTENGTLRFSIGRCCLFVMQPKDLVRDLRAASLKVGVYRLDDTYPTAEADLALPGCLCDQIAMSKNDVKNLPKPFVVKGGFHLLDPGANPSGTLDLDLRLSCFGRSILTHYELRPKYFVFRNQDNERQFCVKRIIPPRDCDGSDGKDTLKCGEAALPEFFEKTEDIPIEAEASKIKPEANQRGKKGKSGKDKGKKKK